MSTGITVSDAATAEFEAFKRSSNTEKYIIFKIVGKEIVKHSSSEDTDFDAFYSLFLPNEAQYAVYKMDYTTDDDRAATKLVSIMWAPDSLPPRAKMVYAGTKGAFTNAMSGISVKIEANDLSDITRDVIIDKCKKI